MPNAVIDDGYTRDEVIAAARRHPEVRIVYRPMLAPERRAKFDEIAKSFGLDPVRMDRFRPWFAAITLSSLSMLRQNSKPGEPLKPSDVQAQAGVDVQLWTWASCNRHE